MLSSNNMANRVPHFNQNAFGRSKVESDASLNFFILNYTPSKRSPPLTLLISNRISIPELHR
jgi:hypothetical protein